MDELMKLVFEKINYKNLKMSKSDFAVLVEKGAEVGKDESQVKKLVTSNLKNLRKFKETTLPMALLEEKDFTSEADSLHVPSDILQSWRQETEGKLKELQAILAVNNQAALQEFIAANPELEPATKIPLSKFVKLLNKDMPAPAPTPESTPNPNAGRNEVTMKVGELPMPPTTTVKLGAQKVTVAPSQGAKPVKKSSAGVFAALGAIIVAAGAAIGAYFLLFAGSPIDPYFNKDVQYGKIVDARDKQEYRTMKVGNQEWIAQNMNYDVYGSICDSCELYGRLYTYDVIQDVCPDGFSIPTRVDIDRFMSMVSLSGIVSKKLGGDDSYGFSALMGGFYSFNDDVVKRRGEVLGFWTTAEYGELAVRMKADVSKDEMDLGGLDKRYGFSVRCIASETSDRRSAANEVAIDKRGGRILDVINLSGSRWLAKNMDVKTSKSYCIDDDEENCNHGRFYEWNSALRVCPEGFRLPNQADLGQLSYSDVALLQLDKGGMRNKKGVFEKTDEVAYIWTSTDVNGLGNYGMINPQNGTLQNGKAAKSSALPVRCIEGALQKDFVYGTFEDERDDRTYRTVQVGTQVWMAENLKIAVEGSYCYDDESSNCETYGRLYEWSDAMNLCPEDFRLPDDSDWATLKNFVSAHGDGLLATDLKSEQGWSTAGEDLFGLGILPSGYRDYDAETYGRLNERAYLWSATVVDDDSASHWAIVEKSEAFSKTSAYKKNARAVRCVREADGSFATTTLGGKEWMREDYVDKNLMLGKTQPGEPFWGMDLSDAKVYLKNAALKACPVGWHLPSDRDWHSLLADARSKSSGSVSRNLMVGKWGYNGECCEPDTDNCIEGTETIQGTDKFGFGAVAGSFGAFGGYRGEGECQSEQANYWSSSGRIFVIDRATDVPELMQNPNFITARVRCVKD